MELLEIKNIKKVFQKNLALNDVSFSIPKGSIFGLLGPNGAGKTTLIRIITQILGPDSGEIYFNGIPLKQEKINSIGYMPEEKGLYKKMKVGEQLLYLAQLKGMSSKDAKTQIRFWLEKLDIVSWYNKTLDELSKGMHQKVQFISTVISQPKLLILDEPFSGLDPINANLLKQEILELNQKGTTIIFSTHRMGDVDELCDDIALINKGQIILSGTVKDIKNQFKENIFKADFTGVEESEIHKHSHFIRKEDNHFLFKLAEGQSPNELLKDLIGNGFEINGFSEVIPTINDIFISQISKNNQI